MNLHEIYLASQLAKNSAGGSDADGLISEVKAQTALNRSTLGYQRKNLLMNKCQTASRNGVNAVINGDGSITLTGSNTGEAFAVYMNMQTGYSGMDINGQYGNNKKFLPNGDYIVSGSKPGARIQVLTSADNATASSLATSMGESEEKFSVTDDDKYVWTRILIVSNASFGEEGVTLYPMIRPAEVADAGYEPYKPSAAEYIEGEQGRSIDLSEYVKKTDYASSSSAGVVAVARDSESVNGIWATSTGALRITRTNDSMVKNENEEYVPLTVKKIPVMMANYSITKTTVSELQAQINEFKAKIEALESK